jgi:2-C-methyl-D-erythritol 4-phosphate cytidylyltransferase
MYKDKKVSVVIVAGGKGTRMGSEIPKQYMDIAGKTIIDTTIYKFEKSNQIDEIILVVNEEEYDYVKNNIAIDYDKIISVVVGGKSRTESVYNGLTAADKNCSIILIHDGVRPFVSYNLISSCIENAYEYKACIPVIEVVDTIKEINKENETVEKTLDRSVLRSVQTPQSFDYKLIRSCYEKAISENSENANFTDDSSIVEYYGYKVKTIEGLQRNMKITTPLDLKIAEILASIY